MFGDRCHPRPKCTETLIIHVAVEFDRNWLFPEPIPEDASIHTKTGCLSPVHDPMDAQDTRGAALQGRSNPSLLLEKHYILSEWGRAPQNISDRERSVTFSQGWLNC